MGRPGRAREPLDGAGRPRCHRVRARRTYGGALDGLLDLADSTGELRVEYQLPYAGPTSLSEERLRRTIDRGEPLEFGHTLEDQIGGQIAAGFVISGFYEDRHRDDPIAAYMPTLIATRATKP